MKPKHYAIAIVFIIGLMVVLIFFGRRNEKKPDETVLVRADSVAYCCTIGVFDTVGDTITSNAEAFRTALNSSATQQLLSRNVHHYEVVIGTNNGDMAMRDSLGNWEVRGDIKAILEQFYQSYLFEKKEKSKKRKSEIKWRGPKDGVNDNIFELTYDGVLLWKYPYKTEAILTDPPSYIDYYHDRNGKDSVVKRAYQKDEDAPQDPGFDGPIDTTTNNNK